MKKLLSTDFTRLLIFIPYDTNAQLPLLKVAALYFDKLVILDPVGASWGRHRRLPLVHMKKY